MKAIVFRVAVGLVVFASQCFAESQPRIAIIIDDLGYQLEAGRRAIELPGPVVCAILPGTPRARLLAEGAHDNGKEVLLHLPLQSVDHHGPMEPGGITLDMSPERFAAVFAEAIDSIPFAAGVNSHRGSLLTRHPGHMRWLMENIRARDGLFFVDSYTTHESVALSIAAETGVAALKRDVFLDADPAPEAILREMERLKAMARLRGHAVAIAHPYAVTLEMLERELPRLRTAGFEIVTVSELIEAMQRSEQEVQRAAAENSMNRSGRGDSKTLSTERGT